MLILNLGGKCRFEEFIPKNEKHSQHYRIHGFERKLFEQIDRFCANGRIGFHDPLTTLRPKLSKVSCAWLDFFINWITLNNSWFLLFLLNCKLTWHEKFVYGMESLFWKDISEVYRCWWFFFHYFHVQNRSNHT